jgi:formylglycine-generating enzyme required for sulfatase activity
MNGVGKRYTTLGDMWQRIRWQADAPGLDARNSALRSDFDAIRKLLDAGDADNAGPRLEQFASRLVGDWEANERARTAGNTRAEYQRLLQSVPERLRSTARYGELKVDGDQAGKQWSEAGTVEAFALADASFGSARQRLSDWLAVEETADEKTARVKDTAEEVTRLSAQLLDEQSRASSLATEIERLRTQYAELGKLNQEDRLAKQAADIKAADLETKLKTEATARAAVEEKLAVAERDAKRVPDLQAALEAAEREKAQAAVELATRPASNGSLSPTTFTRPGVGTKAGDLLTLEVKGVPVRFRWCPPGTFRMGSPVTEAERYNDENPEPVTLTQGYWIMETECWQKLGEVVMGSSKDWDRGRSDQHPAYYVSHEEAVEFAKRFEATLRQAGIAMNGWSISLPTEAQWEYAIRGGTTTAYCFGNNASQLGEYAWYRENAGGTTHPVGTKKPNAWGIRDGHGSLWEWTNDVWADKLSGGTNPKGPTSGSYRVIRGGSGGNSPRGCRSAYRDGYSPGARSGDLGCRLALVPVAGS